MAILSPLTTETDMKTTSAAILIALLLQGCGLTPAQQKWAGLTASVLITGAIAAHELDNGKSYVAPTSSKRGDNRASCSVPSLCK